MDLLIPFALAAIVIIVVGGILLEAMLRLIFGKPTEKNLVRNNTVIYYINANGANRHNLPSSLQLPLPPHSGKHPHANPFAPKYAPIPVEAHRIAGAHPQDLAAEPGVQQEESAADADSTEEIGSHRDTEAQRPT